MSSSFVFEGLKMHLKARGMTYADVARALKISEATVKRIRLRIARTFSWIPKGPIMRYVKSQLPDFFEHAFEHPGELMRMISVRLSREAQVALLTQVEQIAREYSEQHNADARLSPEQR